MKYFGEIIKIAGVEFAGLRANLPRWSKKGVGSLLIYAVIALAVFIFMFSDTLEEPLHLMAGVTMFVLSVTYIVAFINVLQFTSVTYRGWWLTLPYPRYVIVYARLLSMLRFGASIAVPIIIAGIAYYVLALDRWGMQPISLEQFSMTGVALAILLTVAAPIVIALGLVLTTLYSGWMRWIYIVPYFIFSAMSFSAMMLVQMIDVQFLTASYMLIYALIGLVVGWPLTYLMLRYIARVGMYNMANVDSSSNHVMKKPSTQKKGVKINPKRGFSALYQLERSRYTYMSSLLPIRIILYVVALLVGIIAYISALEVGSMNALGFVAFLVTIPLIFPAFWSIMITATGTQKNRLEMWLSFPYPRIQLLVARVAAIWMTAVRYVVVWSIVFWAATIAAMLIHSVGTEHLQLSLVWFAYGLALYVSTLTISIALLQIQSYTAKSSWLALLFAPLYFLAFYQTALLLNHFIPDELGQVATYPDWTRLILLLVIGLPLGLFSVRLGAQHLHYFLRQERPVIVAQTKK